MPELPEMENYKRLISEHLVGKRITQVEINREKSINVPVNIFKENTLNEKIEKIERRAKHLIFHLSSNKVLLLHLMLGGWLYLGSKVDNPSRTKQIIINFGEQNLYFIGLRLGYLHLLSHEELHRELADIGPEPLDTNFTEQVLVKLLKHKKSNLKSTLVDQHIIAGIGNRYSDEICFAARIKPTRNVESLTDQDIKNLFQGIKSVLQNAYFSGGYMDQPFYKGDKLTGTYNGKMNVYKREGEICPRCGGNIVEDKIASKKTFYCPNCQQ